MADENIVVAVQDKVASSIATKLSQIATNARSASSSVADLQKQLNSMNAANNLTAAMAASQSATAQLATAVGNLTTQMSNLNSASATGVTALTSLNGAAQGVAGSLGSVGSTTQQVGSQMTTAASSTSGFGSTLANLSAGAVVVSAVKNAVTDLGGELVHMFEQGYETVKMFTEWQAQADRVRIGLQQVSGDAKATAANTAFLQSTIQKLGLDMATATDGFIKFAASTEGTALQGEKTQQIFQSVSEAATVLHLSTMQVNNTFLALSQMAGKGVISMEELRRQLGDSIPGVMQTAADAMGVTVGQLDKMISSGQVLADDFLPRFAQAMHDKYAGSVEEASNSAQASLNRMSSAWTNLERTIANSGVGQMAANQLNILADAANGISEAMSRAKAAGSGTFGQLMAGTGSALGFLNPTNAFGYQAQSVDGLKAQIKQWQSQLKTTTDLFQQKQIAYNIAHNQSLLTQYGANAPTPPTSDANLSPEALARITAQKQAANVNTFVTDGKFKTPAEVIAKQQSDLKVAFDNATKGLATDSALYIQAYQTYQARLAAINTKAAAPGIRAAHKEQQNELSAQLTALQSYSDQAKNLYQTQTADLQTQLSNQEISQAEYIVAMGKAKQTELQTLQNVAKQEADLAAGKDQKSARERYLNDYKSYGDQLITEAARTQAQLAALNAKTTQDAKKILDAFSLAGQQRDSQNSNSLEAFGMGANALADLQKVQQIMTQAAQARNQLTQQATKDGTQYSTSYVNGIQKISDAELDQITNEKLYFQQRDAMQSNWVNGLTAGMQNVIDQSANVAGSVQTAFTSAFSSMTDALATFVTTGKLNFGSLATSIIADIIKIQLKAEASSIMSALLGSLGGGFSAAGAFGNTGAFAGASSASGSTGAVISGIGGGSSLFGIGYADGGYTGNGGVNQAAGIVHGQEFVFDAKSTAAIGAANLQAMMVNARGYSTGGYVGTPPTIQSGNGNVTVQPQMNVVINNSASNQVTATAQMSTDSNGNQQLDVMINAVESKMAGKIASGRGQLHDSIQQKFGLQSKPGR